MQLVTIEDKEIKLCSGMKEDSFGRTNYDSIVTQEGLIAVCDSKEGEKAHFTFSPWCFSEIKALQSEETGEFLVYYCGKNPLSQQADTLLHYLDNEAAEKDDAYKAAFLVCSILTQAAEDEIELPVIGAGGIIVDIKAEKPAFLFLPPDLFKYSSACLSAAENARNNLGWINPTLLGLPALCFERANLAYRMLTGRLPYPAEDPTDRNADILDRNFLPLELSINGIDRQLAVAVNKGLKLNSNEVSIPGKKKKGKSSEDLTPESSFPLEALLSAKESLNKNVSDADFEQQAQTYMKAQSSKIKTQRTIRRNKAIITVSIIGVIVLIIVTASTIKSNRDNYTSKGLTSTQTVEAFFEGVNKLDTVLLVNLTKGKQPTHYTDTVSQIYVIGKSRQAYGGHRGFLSPQGWLYYVTNPSLNSSAGLYGVTNLKIDGRLSNLNTEIYKINQKPEPVTEENGITLKDNAKSVHNVEYILIHTEGEDSDILLQRAVETFSLTYIKDKWLITKIETELYDIDFDSNAFKKDYFKSIEDNGGDVLKAVQSLRSKYTWLPQDEVLLMEKESIEKESKEMFPFF